VLVVHAEDKDVSIYLLTSIFRLTVCVAIPN